MSSSKQRVDSLRALSEIIDSPKLLKAWLSWPINRDYLYRAIHNEIDVLEGGTDLLRIHRRLRTLEKRADFEDDNKRKAREHLKDLKEAFEGADLEKLREST